jgi:hypothetical protein
MKGLYLLQMEDTPGMDTETKDHSLISLNAITCLSTGDTLQLDVTVAGDTLRALVDSSSMHYFISVAAASRLHLDPLP